MYAAAGGASLASRQARQRQRQQNNKNKVLQQQAKLAEAKTSDVVTPTRTQLSRQFHQLPSSYLRTPQTQSRKLSAGYATQSKLLLPIVEGNNQQSLCQPHHQQFEPYTRPLSPRNSIRPTDPRTCQHLTKSATATLPLNSQANATPPATPIISVTTSGTKCGLGDSRVNESNQYGAYTHALPVPQDSIIVTPATPLTSPGHRAAANASNDGATQLERKCSFYRVRRSDAFEYDASPTSGPGAGITTTQAENQADPYVEDGVCYGLPNGGSGHKWTQQATYCAYCDDGSYICDHIECAQGRAAWLERGRRCSVQDNNPASCHRRWVKRNRIQDSSLGGSSDDEDLLGVLRGPSSFANAFLYVGLGTIAIGLVIAFVGTGEKGFKTVELRLIGPSLIGIGLVCCILRICFCICPSHCLSSSKRARKKNNKIDADHTTSLLRGENKRVSIAKGPHQKFPLTHKSRGNSKMINEGMEALRQIATTSLFLQNEQKPSTNRIVPIIKEPDKYADAPIEMKKFDTTLNISDITDDEDDDDDTAVAVALSSYHNQNESLVLSQSKLGRQRSPTNNQQEEPRQQDSDTLLMETSLMIVNPMPSTSTSRSIGPPHSSQSPKPCSSRGLDLPLHNHHQQFLASPMVQSPPPGTSSSYHHQYRGGIPTYPSTQAHHSRNPPPLSASGSYSAPNSTTTATIVEPELVLSPAKLGQ